jgi:Mrp family chromosome partitioning ATPase
MNLTLPNEPRIVPIVEADPRSRDVLHGAAHKSIAPAHRGYTLPAHLLEERGLIHAGNDAHVRAQTDAFREIRTRLLAMAGARNFITLVVPVNSGDGASYVARNLALAFALNPAKSALLIDCNLPTPTQHEVLRVEPKGGGWINHLEQPGHDIRSAIYRTGVANMALLPAGTGSAVDSEYFSSAAMHAMLDTLRSADRDRYLFLDGPAANASPDARILAELADFVVLVARYARTSAAAITQAAAVFNPAQFAGVVFNEG